MEQINSNQDNFQAKVTEKIPTDWEFRQVFLQNIENLGALLGQNGLGQEWQKWF